MRISSFLAVLAFLTLPVACGDGSGTPEEDGASAVLPGKADDYLSPTSREYRLWGLGDVELATEWADKDEASKEAQARELLGYRFKAYAYFINLYVTDKEHEDANAAYGGFSGLVRTTSLDFLLEPLDDSKLKWTFIWELEMGGPRDLMDRLPMQVRPTGERYFLVRMPKLTESALVSGSFPKDFDPAKYSGELEELEVMLEPVKESFDGYPDYLSLFADDRLDVLIVVGGDYNSERYDLKAAAEIFAWLKKAGYAHAATTLQDLTLESPPFTRTLKANGRDLKVEVTLLYADIVPDAELDRLRQRIVQGYATADLVVYDGHAGLDPSYSGVVYHYNPRHAISANDFATMALPDAYQIFLFNGCKTYGAYPEAIYKNPKKTTKNLDIVSTVNFSWLSMQPFTTSGFLAGLLTLKGGTHDPRTYSEILADINKSSNWNVYYGVHGIDDNAHLNPYAKPESLCTPCKKDADCPGNGNRCIQYAWGKACAAECTADDGCPAGYACASVAEGAQITGRQCLPKTYACN